MMDNEVMKLNLRDRGKIMKPQLNFSENMKKEKEQSFELFGDFLGSCWIEFDLKQKTLVCTQTKNIDFV